MKEEICSNNTFNIYGGNVQILPNATKAELHIYGNSCETKDVQPITQESSLSDEALRLGLYIDKVENLQGYLTMLSACTTAKEIAEVVAIMLQREPKLTGDEVDKARFISLLPPLAPRVTKGITTDNIRIHIDNAVAAHKKKAQTFRASNLGDSSII